MIDGQGFITMKDQDGRDDDGNKHSIVLVKEIQEIKECKLCVQEKVRSQREIFFKTTFVERAEYESGFIFFAI